MPVAYYAGPSTSAAGVITEVSTLTGLATLLQVATPSTRFLRVIGWGISFKGVSATATPGMVYLLDCDVGMSAATSLTPVLWSNPDATPSLCVGGTGATCVNDGAVTEGTITASRLLDAQEVHPQTGYANWFPSDCRPLVAESRFLRLRTNFDAAISSIPFIIFDE